MHVSAEHRHRAGEASETADFADWISSAPESPLASTSPGLDRDPWFDLKVIYQQSHSEVDIDAVPDAFKPVTEPYALVDCNNVFAVDPRSDIFDSHGIDRGGAVVVVRPDQYVAAVLPLAATRELAGFFEPIAVPRRVALSRA